MGLPEAFPIETWHSTRPSLQKKKKNLFRCVLYYSCLFRMEYSFLASRLCFYLWLCQINLNLVGVPILSYLGVCVWQYHRVCFLFSLKVSWYQIWNFCFFIVNVNFLIESWFFLKSKLESGFRLNIIHVWLCLSSSFVFCFFCASEFPFLIWYAHNVKKKKVYPKPSP